MKVFVKVSLVVLAAVGTSVVLRAMTPYFGTIYVWNGQVRCDAGIGGANSSRAVNIWLYDPSGQFIGHAQGGASYPFEAAVSSAIGPIGESGTYRCHVLYEELWPNGGEEYEEQDYYLPL